ncbi:uncharacterized protein LOC135691407 [Rhopilema esculentum]|uniref:uncharacterized protein LOC135691407 n=1 Tax=Rhopilema esculentum TaxID=499914 RepID=UPI0031D74572
MSDTRLVNTALQEYFLSLSGQIAAANRLKDAVTELLEERDEAAKSGKGNLDEWDVLDQSYICIKLRNAFAEIDTKLEAFKKNVSTACKQKDKHENYVKNPQSTSEEVLALILSIISELHQYHKTVAECIAPIVEYSAYRERYPTQYEIKECSSVPVTWKAVNEVNRTLRYGYGLSKEDLAAILSWMHGEDLSESARKHLNLKVDGLILTYRERLSNLDSCEFDVPVAFQLYPLVLQDVIKDCCSPVESVAATGQALPVNKEDLETLIRREIPRVQVQVGDALYDVASPGKAFENTKQKMVAVRLLVARSAKLTKIGITKEQLDLFSLKVLATACISVSNASARTAVLIAFGKSNLIQVKPSNSKPSEPAQISINNGSIQIEVPSQWALTEDATLFQSLSRDSTWNSPVATVDAVYKSVLNFKAEVQRQAQSLPVVRIIRCSGIATQKGLDKKDPTTKGLRKRLSRATSKLFNRKSMIQKDGSRQSEGLLDSPRTKVEGIDNPGISISDSLKGNVESLATDDDPPVPPPRPRRKARTKRKSEATRKQLKLLEEAKHDPQWFTSCKKLDEPALPDVEGGSTSLSIASFEELKDVIDLLSGSSTSSLGLNQPLDIDRNVPPKAGPRKEEVVRAEIESKGKVSPSDSGLGSSMSVQSHPSVTSISQLHGNEASVLKTHEIYDADVSEETISMLVANDLNEAVESLENQPLTANTFIGVIDDTGQEDAEVEMYNDDLRDSSESLDGEEERENDETPSNGKTIDFVDIETELSNEMKGDIIVESVSGDQEKSDQCCDEDQAEVPEISDIATVADGSIAGQVLNAEILVEQDQHCYDADGSDQSEENVPVEREEASSKSIMHGSNESLYYSAWALNDVTVPKNEPSKLEGPVTGDMIPTDSYFASGLDSSFSEKADTSEDFEDCKEPDEMLYQHFNPRFSWPVGLGDRLAAIWDKKEMQSPQTSNTTTSNEIWSQEDTFKRDRRGDTQSKPNEGFKIARGQQVASSGNGISSPGWITTMPNLEDTYMSAPVTQSENWDRYGQMTSRQKEDMHHPEWHANASQTVSRERSQNFHTSLQHLRISENSQPQSTLVSPGQGWSSASHVWNRGFQPYRGQNYGRPSSVPETISRPSRSHSPIIRQPMDTIERHGQSPAFNMTPVTGTAVPSHIIGQHRQTWGRDVNSEPLLTASTKRTISECEALLRQQQRQRGRVAIPPQYRGQKW